MQIDKILYQLLLQHECIIIPNFGGFIVRESPCNFNSNKDILKPYIKSVFFNPHLNENDGLLINAIVNSKNISYTEATSVLEKWIENLNNNIQEIGKCNLTEIGVFYRGNDNGKWFTADSHLNLALTTYGLKSVKSSVVNTSSIEIESPKIVYKSLADNKPIERFELPKKNWRAWAAAAAIAVVAHIGYLSFDKTETSVHQASIVPSILDSDLKTEEALSVETPSKEVVPEINLAEQTQNEEITPIEKPVDKTVTDPNPSVEPENTRTDQPAVNNEIAVIEIQQVIAKYRLEQNALYHQKDLSKANINTVILKNKNELYEVIITSEVSK